MAAVFDGQHTKFLVVENGLPYAVGADKKLLSIHILIGDVVESRRFCGHVGQVVFDATILLMVSPNKHKLFVGADLERHRATIIGVAGQ